MNKVVAIVGMPGAGKTEAADVLKEKGFGFIRLGQLTLDEVKKRGLEPTEANEREIRERIRKENGMDAFATLNFPKIEELLKKCHVVVDGLYSWEEYLAFSNRYGKNLHVVAVYASPATRYSRLERQKTEPAGDIRRRHFTKEESESRDRAQLENLHTSGPIAIADFTIINESSLEDLKRNAEKVIGKIMNR